MENSEKIIRSELWHKIYNIVRELKLEHTSYDSMDHPSCATELEFLFIRETESQNKEDKQTVCNFR